MRLEVLKTISLMKRVTNVLICLGLVGIWIASFMASANAQASTPVRYSISPASSSVQPNGTVNITLSVQTDVEIAGASVHVAYNNASYDAFQTASPSGIYFVDYKTGYDDILFICNDNRCAPGTYQIATITVKVGSSGNATVGFNPKETADPSLNLIQASGASGTYNVTGSAPASPTRPARNTYTIPKQNDDGTTEPVEVTNEQYIERQQQAQRPSNNQTDDDNDNDGSDKTFWTGKNIVIAGIAISFSFITAIFLIAKFYVGGGGPKGPGSSGPTITPGGQGPIYTR